MDKIISQTELECGKKYSILDLVPAHTSLKELNNRSIGTLFIRKEYEIAHDTIVKRINEMAPGKRVVFLFTGQPGIGKSFFLLFLLVIKLREKQAVALQISHDEFILFDENGASKHGKYDDAVIPKGAWPLSYSHTSHEPCYAFQYSEHVIHTSSPTECHWKGWVKQLGAKRYVMDVWPLEEFKTLLSISNLNIPRGETLFHKYGSNVKRIIDVLNDPNEEATHEDDVLTGADQIAQRFSTILLDLESLNFKSSLFSKIFTVRPKNMATRLPILTIPTAYLFKTLAVAVSRQALAEQQAIFARLTAHPTLGAAAGWWFEICAHVRLSDPSRPRIKTHGRGVSKSPSIPSPKTILSGEDALREIKPPFDFYWRPQEPNFEGIDALIRSGNNVRVLQYTKSSESSHVSATNGLNEIYKLMNFKINTKWHLDIVGPKLSLANSARDSHRLFGMWAMTPIYSSEVELGILDKEMLEKVLNESTDDTYPGYCIESTTGV